MSSGQTLPIRTGENMRMQIDQPWGNVKSRNIDRFPSSAWLDRWCNGRDQAIANRNITDTVDLVLRIDYMAALQQEVVRRLGRIRCSRANRT